MTEEMAKSLKLLIRLCCYVLFGLLTYYRWGGNAIGESEEEHQALLQEINEL